MRGVKVGRQAQVTADDSSAMDQEDGSAFSHEKSCCTWRYLMRKIEMATGLASIFALSYYSMPIMLWSLWGS